jgi:hypothetical protein
MADLRTLPMIEDVGSEQLKALTDSYNALLDSLGTYMDAVETAAGASATAATAFLAEVETNDALVLKIGRLPGIQARPRREVTV